MTLLGVYITPQMNAREAGPGSVWKGLLEQKRQAFVKKT